MGMSVGSGGNEAAPMTDINTTPLVDVMLVLLIIFMITAPLMANKVPVKLPEAANQPDEAEGRAIVLSIQDRGGGNVQLFWEEDPVQFDGMLNRLKTEAVKNPQPEFKIRADKSLSFKEVREVLGAAKTAGIRKVGFVTAPGN
ncbi:MAG: biopolymer transporter ExbD [Lysobacterales bacterium]